MRTHDSKHEHMRKHTSIYRLEVGTKKKKSYGKN